MLNVFGFERLGVVLGDLYFVDPDPLPGQEGPEQGVRLELRLLEAGDLRGGIYSARPIAVGRPLWRVDLLESVERPGTLDRAHHHPYFTDWEPCPRRFLPELSADPLGWLAERFTHLDDVLKAARAPLDELGGDEVAEVRAAGPAIVAAADSVLDRVRAGELARPPGDEPVDSARVSWL